MKNMIVLLDLCVDLDGEDQVHRYHNVPEGAYKCWTSYLRMERENQEWKGNERSGLCNLILIPVKA